MSHYRYNLLKNEWVIISPKRVRRPSDFEISSSEWYDIDSPFVYGNEHKTPSEIYAIREYGSKKDTPGWKVRVVPNKYNALEIEKNPTTDFDGINQLMEGFGAHEVIIDTPKFPAKFHDLTPLEVSYVLRAARDRAIDLQRDGRIKYIGIFKNQGPLAGASISHSHTQIIAMPIIPKNIHTEIEQSRKYFEESGRSLFFDMVKSELRSRERVVDETDEFVSYCPYASFWPFETVIAQKSQKSDFLALNEQQLQELATALLIAVRRINMALKNVSYNILFKLTPPKREAATPNFYYKLDEFYRWHIEIVPRIPVIGGFELMSGTFINTVAPEESAKFLRNLVAF